MKCLIFLLKNFEFYKCEDHPIGIYIIQKQSNYKFCVNCNLMIQ